MNSDMTDCSKTKLLEKGLVEEIVGGYVCSGDSHLSPIPQAQGLSLGPDTQSGRVDSWLQHGQNNPMYCTEANPKQTAL